MVDILHTRPPHDALRPHSLAGKANPDVCVGRVHVCVGSNTNRSGLDQASDQLATAVMQAGKIAQLQPIEVQLHGAEINAAQLPKYRSRGRPADSGVHMLAEMRCKHPHHHGTGPPWASELVPSMPEYVGLRRGCPTLDYSLIRHHRYQTTNL